MINTTASGWQVSKKMSSWSSTTNSLSAWVISQGGTVHILHTHSSSKGETITILTLIGQYIHDECSTPKGTRTSQWLSAVIFRIRSFGTHTCSPIENDGWYTKIFFPSMPGKERGGGGRQIEHSNVGGASTSPHNLNSSMGLRKFAPGLIWNLSF